MEMHPGVLQPADQLSMAIFLASTAFLNINDKAGRPYIFHCLAVMDGVKQYNDDELSAAAVLHDIVEDTDMTYVNLKEAGLSSRVIHLINNLTRERNETYDHYIDIISLNLDAIKIKLADLTHNMQIQRMECLIDSDCNRIAKYHAAYHKLYNILHKDQS